MPFFCLVNALAHSGEQVAGTLLGIHFPQIGQGCAFGASLLVLIKPVAILSFLVALSFARASGGIAWCLSFKRHSSEQRRGLDRGISLPHIRHLCGRLVFSILISLYFSRKTLVLARSTSFPFVLRTRTGWLPTLRLPSNRLF